MASDRLLDPLRALVKLWLYGSIAWIGFWLWRDLAGCFVAGNGALWCPDASGEAVRATSYLMASLKVLGPPAALFLLGLMYLRFARKKRRVPAKTRRHY